MELNPPGWARVPYSPVQDARPSGRLAPLASESRAPCHPSSLRAAGIYLSSWRDPHGKRNLWTLEVRREDFQKGVGEQTPQEPPQGEMPSRRAFAGIAGIAGFTPPLSSKPAQEEVDEWSP